MRWRSVVAVLVGSTVMASCTNGPARVSEPTGSYVTVENGTKTFEPHGSSRNVVLRISIHNPGDSAIFVARCGTVVQFDVEMKAAEAWKPVYEAPCGLAFLTPLELGPQETREFDVVVTSHVGNIEPSFDLDNLPGEHRLVLKIYRTYRAGSGVEGLEQMLDVSDRASNSFWLKAK